MRGRWAWCRQQPGRLAAVLAAAATAGTAGPRSLGAQGFWERFSYEGLRLSAIGVELGGVTSDRLSRAWSPALRVDYGLIAPEIRVLVGMSYFRGDFNASEIARFAQRLRGVVRDPTGDFTIDVGRITWSDLEAALDLQYLFPAGRTRSYLGLGLGVHLRDADGTAIEGTFVEDALDAIAAGLEISGGLELGIAPWLALTADLRGVLTSELRLASARGGIQYRWPQRGPPR